MRSASTGSVPGEIGPGETATFTASITSGSKQANPSFRWQFIGGGTSGPNTANPFSWTSMDLPRGSGQTRQVTIMVTGAANPSGFNDMSQVGTMSITVRALPPLAITK